MVYSGTRKPSSRLGLEPQPIEVAGTESAIPAPSATGGEVVRGSGWLLFASDRANVLLMLTFVALFLLVPILAMNSRLYPQFSNYIYDEIIAYKYNVHGRADDVVLYGDSSLLHGVDATAASRLISARIFNLGIPVNSFVAEPGLALDRYLANNSRPRLIVLYMSPGIHVEHFDYDQTHYYEAAYTLQNFGSLGETLKFYAANPRRAFGVAAVVVRNLAAPPEPRRAVYLKALEAMTAQNGYMPYPGARQTRSLLGHLKAGAAGAPIQVDRAFAEAFRRKYEARGYKVLVYFSPTPALSDAPDCRGESGVVLPDYKAVTPMTVYTLPCDAFIPGSSAHLTPQGTARNTAIFADFLKNLDGGAGGGALKVASR